MTPLQRIMLRLSEVRQRLNELSQSEDLTTEETAEIEQLSNEYATLETRHRAALIANPDPDPAPDPQRPELVERASIAEVLAAAIEQRHTTGATRELQDELGIAGNQVPLETLIERRDVTPAPNNVGRTQADILPVLFPEAAAGYLGVDMPTVPAGDAVYPVLTTGATATSQSDSTAIAETTGALSAAALSPARLQAAFHYLRADNVRLVGMDAALRDNLRSALADGLDNRVLVGASGFLGSASPLAAVNDPSAEVDYAGYRAELYNATVLDGIHANRADQVRFLFGAATYAHAATKLRSATDPTSALETLMADSGGVRIGAHIPAPASNDQALLISMGQSPRSAVAPMWEGITLIPDEVTRAQEGEIVITAVMLYAFLVTRPAAFRRRAVQLAT